MKLPISWLRDWVDIPWDVHELARRLTAAGFEVEGIEPAAPAFTGVVVAAITATAPHPEADRLSVCQVDAGTGALLQIVCGAANARAGIKVPLAQVGAVLPGDLSIKAAKLRGVESAGMLCSAKELGLATASSGLLELAADAQVGQSALIRASDAPGSEGNGVILNSAPLQIFADGRDTDGDGIKDMCDNCPTMASTDLIDMDGDELGDACDPCPTDPENGAGSGGRCADDNANPQVPLSQPAH